MSDQVKKSGSPTPAAATAAKKPVHRKGQQRRAEIVETTKKRLIEQGMNGLVLRDIANEMGITHGNLQYYFATKNDLLRAIFDDEVERYTSGLHEAILSTSDPLERIGAIIDSSMDVLRSKETRLWRILYAIADDDPIFARILKLENELYEATLAGELAEVAPHLDENRRLQIAKLIRLVIDGLGITFTYQDPSDPVVGELTREFKRVFSEILQKP